MKENVFQIDTTAWLVKTWLAKSEAIKSVQNFSKVIILRKNIRQYNDAFPGVETRKKTKSSCFCVLFHSLPNLGASM